MHIPSEEARTKRASTTAIIRIFGCFFVLLSSLGLMNGLEFHCFAGSSDPRKITPLQPGGTNIPPGFFIQFPSISPRNINSGYSPFGGSSFHKGSNRVNSANDYYALDVQAKYDPVYAAARGIVIYAGWAGGGWKSYGQIVVIDHGNGFQSNYAHLNEVNVRAGQSVA